MEASRGANLVGMLVLSPDVCLSPYLAKKNIFLFTYLYLKYLYLYYIIYCI